jgi:hypothetical protein
MMDLILQKKVTESSLERLFKNYHGEVDNYLFDIFNTIVKPFCNKRGWEFLSVNGSYYFFTKPESLTREDRISGEYDLPEDFPDDPELQGIMGILAIVVSGFEGSDIGGMMQDYSPKKLEK